MREITEAAGLDTVCAGDALCRWAGRGLTGGARAWVSAGGRAVVAAAPGISRRDRMAVWGEPAAAARLVGAVLEEVGPAYRPFGDRAVIAGVVEAVPELAAAGEFGWMDHAGRAAEGNPAADEGVRWLAEGALPEVAGLIDRAHPSSYARPGAAGVERWAGIRDARGALVAVGALAWSAPDVGFLAGIAVAPEARAGGLGRRLCAVLRDAALTTHGTAALMVDDTNHSALRLYRALGFTYRPLAAAGVRATAERAEPVRA